MRHPLCPPIYHRGKPVDLDPGNAYHDPMPLDHDPLFRWCAFTLLMVLACGAWGWAAYVDAVDPALAGLGTFLCLMGCYTGGRRIGKALRGP